MAKCEEKNVMEASHSGVTETSLEFLRKEFNRNRKIVLKNVPGITVEEVKEFLGEYNAKNILISKKFKHAVVTLKDEMASEGAIAALNGTTFRDNKVEVKFNPCNRLLCVGNLPADMKDIDFRRLVESYGPIERCFLMGSDTGASKRYGFVEFSKTVDEVKEICHQLHGKTLSSGTVITCDILPASVVDIEQLHASCLCVKNLPTDFADDDLLLNKFSVIAKPLFCRVARKDDTPVGFAIVEFADGVTAENACRQLENLVIEGQQVELEMCVPGQTVPEAFCRQMSLLQKNAEMQRPRAKRKLPSKLYNVHCKTPILDPKLNAVLKENSVSVLNNFKKLLHRLEQCRVYENQQTLSDEPGLLGEAPLSKPSLYSQLNVQCAVLSVYLAALVQQMIPDISTPMLMQLLPPDCNMQAMMYNPMIMQTSCTMYSLVAFCKGENESDLRPIIYPFVSPLVSEDSDTDVMMAVNQGGRAANLIGMLGSLQGGIGTLVDVMQLLATVQKALDNLTADNDKCETSSTEVDGTSSLDQSSILGPPPLMTPKSPLHMSSSHSQFAFNHVFASHIQAQLLQRITMPASEEPVPAEARLPIASLGGVVSLFDLPLVRPLIAKSSQKSSTSDAADSSRTAIKQISTSSAPVAATGDGILGPSPVPRFQAPQNIAAVLVRPGGSSGNIAPLQGPAIRPLTGRNFAGAHSWPRPQGPSKSVMTNQGGEQKQWPGGWKDGGNSKSGKGWHWNSETAGNVYEAHQWDSGPEAVEPDWNSGSRQPGIRPVPSGRNLGKVPPKPSVGQSSFPSVRGKPPQMSRPRFDRPPGPAGRSTSSTSKPSSAARPQYSGDSSGWHSNQPGGYSSNYRPPGPAGRGTSSTSTPSSAAWPQYSGDSSGWHSNQPGGYSSNFSGTGKSSAAMPWSQPNKPNSASFTSQSSETYATPNQFSANPPVMSGHQQQTSLSSQVQPAVSKSDDGAIPCQPSPASGGAYGWNNNAAAGQWQTQSQWPWPQNDNQWPSSQPFQYTPGSENTSNVAPVAAVSSSDTGTAGGYDSYNTNVWPGDTGAGYNTGGYDMNAMYNSYAQMYEQYYSSQSLPAAGSQQQQPNVGAMYQQQQPTTAYQSNMSLPAAGSHQQQQQPNVGAMYQQQQPTTAYQSNMDYAAAGQKHAYPTPDTMNAALEAFYGNEQGSAKRPRLN